MGGADPYEVLEAKARISDGDMLDALAGWLYAGVGARVCHMGTEESEGDCCEFEDVKGAVWLTGCIYEVAPLV